MRGNLRSRECATPDFDSGIGLLRTALVFVVTEVVLLIYPSDKLRARQAGQ